MEFSRDKVYWFDGDDVRGLEWVMKRLYDDRPLTGDERRDLANKMWAHLRNSVSAEVE